MRTALTFGNNIPKIILIYSLMNLSRDIGVHAPSRSKIFFFRVLVPSNADPPPHHTDFLPMQTSRDTWDTTGYGQQAGGTHPTGMYTC